MSSSREYMFHYFLNDKEYSKFIELTKGEYTDNKYTAFIIEMLRLLNHDFNKLLAVLSIAVEEPSKRSRRLFPSRFYSNTLRLIKEAIVLTNYTNFIKEDNKVDISSFSKTTRVLLASISRSFIYRTLKKYSLV